jgi:hypothetical protein
MFLSALPPFIPVPMFEHMRRLHPRGAASRGVCVDAEGATLGPDCILVRQTATGYRELEREEAATVQRVVLDDGLGPDWLFDQSRRIAQALSSEQIALAQIYGLYIPINGLDDRQLRRLASIAKAGFNPDEPRFPKGDPHGGEWTGGEDGGNGTTSPVGSSSSVTLLADMTADAGGVDGGSQNGESSSGDATDPGGQSTSSANPPSNTESFHPPMLLRRRPAQIPKTLQRPRILVLRRRTKVRLGQAHCVNTGMATSRAQGQAKQVHPPRSMISLRLNGRSRSQMKSRRPPGKSIACCVALRHGWAARPQSLAQPIHLILRSIWRLPPLKPPRGSRNIYPKSFHISINRKPFRSFKTLLMTLATGTKSTTSSRPNAIRTIHDAILSVRGSNRLSGKLGSCSILETCRNQLLVFTSQSRLWVYAASRVSSREELAGTV